MGPLIGPAAVDDARRLVEDALAKGARLVAGGDRVPHIEGNFFAPTVLDGVTDDARIMREEPFAPIATFEDTDDVIARANALRARMRAVWGGATPRHRIGAHRSFRP
ncbi:MAG: aldehyde dehydrogenase family protein [Microbacterium sp.]